MDDKESHSNFSFLFQWLRILFIELNFKIHKNHKNIHFEAVKTVNLKYDKYILFYFLTFMYTILT